MKIAVKVFSIIFVLVMVLLNSTVGFTEEMTNSKELDSIRIASIPLKNLITFNGGKAETPDGIRVELYYDNNTSSIVTIKKKGDDYYADDVKIIPQPNVAVVSYGSLTETLVFENGIKVQYNYYSSRLFPLKYFFKLIGNINIIIN